MCTGEYIMRVDGWMTEALTSKPWSKSNVLGTDSRTMCVLVPPKPKEETPATTCLFVVQFRS